MILALNMGITTISISAVKVTFNLSGNVSGNRMTVATYWRKRSVGVSVATLTVLNRFRLFGDATVRRSARPDILYNTDAITDFMDALQRLPSKVTGQTGWSVRPVGVWACVICGCVWDYCRLP